MVCLSKADVELLKKALDEDGGIGEEWRERLFPSSASPDDGEVTTGHLSGEERFRQLFNEMTSGFALHEVICDDNGKPVDYRFLEINPAFETLTGLKAADLTGRTVKEALPLTEGHWIDTYGRVALSGEPIQFENYSQELDRHYSCVAYCPQKGQFAVIFTDVTERMRAEEEKLQFQAQMLQTQKLESLGVLAGGIAHDFNNLLMAILGNADIALDELPPNTSALRHIEEIEAAARRAADLCRQMLAYSGKGRFVVQPIDLREVVEDMEHLLRISISKSAVLKFRFADELPAIRADAAQMGQIVLNLVINASDALEEKSGVISVSTGAMECDKSYLTETYLDDDLPESTYVYMEISDTGCGMGEETRRNVFDPFFTTKFTGRGLGMAAVLGIVRGHRGAVKIYSEPGRGTTMKVLFPAVNAPPTSIGRKTRDADHWMGCGTVLVVDDEPSVRTVSRFYLKRHGFDVLLASDGREALAKFAKQEHDIRCVVLDLTMPHMDGEVCFREIRRMNADVPVILSSGYNEQDVTQRFAGKGIAGFVQKPYKAVDLIREIKKILQQAESS